MSDPFARWRERRRVPPPSNAADKPLARYQTVFLNRGWSFLLLLIWLPVVIGGIVALVLYEQDLNDIPYSTGPRVLFMLLLLASLALVPLLGPTSRLAWTLFADRIEIRERPFIPLLGRYRSATVPFADIFVARMGEMLSGMSLFEIETSRGQRFRLAPTTIGKGKSGQIDEAGLHAFVDAIQNAITSAGLPRPPGEQLPMATSGLLGVIILGAITAMLGALGLVGLWMVLSQGEAIGLQLMGFVLPFALLFGGLCLNRWRKWRAARAVL
jgi:hypothetical protein